MTYNFIDFFIRQSTHVAIYYEDQKITYTQLYESVSRYANKLSITHNPGDEILIMVNDCPEYFYLFWGAVKAGIKPMLLNPMISQQDKDRIINEYHPKTIFTNENIKNFDQESLDFTDNLPVYTTSNNVCFYLFSSGTTGYIKRIPHKYKDIVATCINYAKNTLYINAYDICFSAAKLFFAYGFGNSMTFPLYVGASTVLMSEAPTAKNTLEIIEKYKPTIYFGIPTLYSYQLKLLSQKEKNLSSLRICVSAGEPLPAIIYENWKKTTDLTILDGIGTTEALHIFISNRHEDHEPNCSGKIVSGYKAKIVDIADNEVLDGEIGYLKIKGNSITSDSEWLATGDMFIKKGSKFYYQGRSSDMLKISGMWVSPSEIEAKIIEHEDVLEAGVVLGWTKDGLTKPKAYVVLNDFSKNNVNTKISIKRKCINDLPVNHYPHWIEFVDKLPKTTTGKLRRHILREWQTCSPLDSNDIAAE